MFAKGRRLLLRILYCIHFIALIINAFGVRERREGGRKDGKEERINFLKEYLNQHVRS
jgi:hypothetical protein